MWSGLEYQSYRFITPIMEIYTGNGMHKDPTKPRIFLVDDDPVVTNTLEEGFRQAGYALTVFTNAKTALLAYQNETPDVAIVDIGLPDAAGTELAAAMLRHRFRPILILSGHTDQSKVQQAIQSGVVGYLVKPLSAQQLIPSIETAWARFMDIREDVSERLSESVKTTVPLDAVLEQLAFAIAVVDDERRIIYNNGHAQQILDTHPLVYTSDGRLCAHKKQRELTAALKQGTRGNSSSAIKLTDGLHHLNIFVSILHNSDVAIVLMIDVDHTSVAPARVLRALYGLTAKESQLAEAMLNGRTLDEYCLEKHVSMNTTKSHLKAIYRKTNTSRQAELIRLLSRLFDNVSNVFAE